MIDLEMLPNLEASPHVPVRNACTAARRPGGFAGGVVRTVAESPDRRARLVDMVRRAESADDEEVQEQPEEGDGHLEQDGTTGPSGDEPAPSEPAPSPEDAAEEDVPVEEDPPDTGPRRGWWRREGRAEHDIVDDEERDEGGDGD